MRKKRSHHWENKETRDLCAAFLKLKTSEEAHKFLRDLCTAEEIDEMARRWQAARLLAKGMAYRKVAKEAGLSTATVSRVAAWLEDGAGGYRILLHRLGIV